MVGLYGPAYFRRFRELGACVENGSSVVDLCCGFGDFYVYALRDKGIKYTGVDLSGEFAVYAAKKGINVQQGNIENYEFPSADYYVMIGSLYHFQNPQDVLNRMITASRKRVLIMEPIRNLTNSKYKIISKLSQYFTNEGNSHNNFRFSEQTLDEFVNRYFKNNIIEAKKIVGGRDKIYILGNN